MAERNRRATSVRHGGGNAVYGLGLIGALVFYIHGAHGFWAVVLAILKSLVWPALLIYHVLRYVGA